MLTWIVRRKLAAFERRYNYDTSYMRDLLAADWRALWRFSRVTGISEYRKDVPLDIYYGAKLTGTLLADCGPCTQLAVAMALEDGVAAPVIASIVAGDAAAMGRDVSLGARFARTVLARDPEADVVREEVARRWGPRAVVSLAFAVVASQLFPTLKYALGHGHACTRVVIGDAVVTPHAKAI